MKVQGSAIASSVSRTSLVPSGGFSFQHSKAGNSRGRVVVDDVQRLSVSDDRFSGVLRVIFEMISIIDGLNPWSKDGRSSNEVGMARGDNIKVKAEGFNRTGGVG
jgi:hypothetical protein